ncbi:MAG: hypothetical protein P8170_22105 [Gemmatimonadota bacterium]
MRRRRVLALRLASLIVPAVLWAAAACDPSGSGGPWDSAEAGPFDVLITNARVVDGAGNPWFRADVGIRGNRIAAVGHLRDREAERLIDAADRVVSPGFIDMMGQSSLVLVTDPASAESKLRQGITTYLSGEGGSPAPQNEETLRRPPVVDGDTLRWRTYAEYFALVEGFGIPINVVHDVGLTQVRRAVLGEGDVQPTREQLELMKGLVRQGMEDGAVGVSTSLIYPPAVYASTEELIELTRVAGEYGGTYFTHMRNESHAVLDAIREALEIGRGAGVPVHIYQSGWDPSFIPATMPKARTSSCRHCPTPVSGRSCAVKWNRPRTGRIGTGMWAWIGTRSSSYPHPMRSTPG